MTLSACSSEEKPLDNAVGGALTLTDWNEYEEFLSLLSESCSDIKLDTIPYSGANRTSYGWTQMQAGDIPDIFITSQIVDGQLASEQLADLSGYDFINSFPTSVLDQVSVDGGIYLLPVNYAMYGILYNKTLMNEKGWDVPTNFSQLEALCEEIKKEGMIPGIADARLTGGPFSSVFNLAKTDWLTTPEGAAWERDFLAGKATAKGTWESTMDYVQRYIDIGMFHTDPEDRKVTELIREYLGQRKAVFCAASYAVSYTVIPDSTDELGMMPYISKDGSKNIYMYSAGSYIGISKRLTEPGNEKKLESAVRMLSLLYSPEGQAIFINESSPCVIGVRSNEAVPEGSLIFDAQKALWEGRAFPMTYAKWEDTISDIGQIYKDWFKGESGVDGARCIARMDELQSNYLNSAGGLYFCESTENFTLEETAELVGKALGSAAKTDASMIPVGSFYRKSDDIKFCITGKLYAGSITSATAYAIAPAADGEYSVLTMTGAQAKELAAAGFAPDQEGRAYPYVLVTKGGKELNDTDTYRIAFLAGGYDRETGTAYNAQTEKGSLKSFVRDWLEEQKTVSPGGNPWN